MIEEMIKSTCISGGCKMVGLTFSEGEDREWESVATFSDTRTTIAGHADDPIVAIRGLQRKIREHVKGAPINVG